MVDFFVRVSSHNNEPTMPNPIEYSKAASFFRRSCYSCVQRSVPSSLILKTDFPSIRIYEKHKTSTDSRKR
jgi:hypothetical protein